MNYKFLRNSVVLGLLTVGVGLWGGQAQGARATGVNTSSGTEETGPISAEFQTDGYNNDTYIDNVSFDINNIYLEPLVENNFDFTITDLDGFDGLTVQYRFFFDVDHYANTDSVSKLVGGFEEFELQGNATLDTAYAAHVSTGADGDAFVLAEKSGSTSNDYFEVIYTNPLTSAGVSWQLGSNGYVQGSNIYERVYSVNFTPSKVAKFSYDNEWTVGIRVLDTNDSNAIVAEYFLTSIDMDWYGEIVVPDGLSLDFNTGSTVEVGSDYADNTLLIEDVLFISNGQFEQLIGSDNIWTSDKADPNGGGNYSAYLGDANSIGFNSIQYFHMVVSDTQVLTNHAAETSINSMNFGYADTTVSTQNGTTESGTTLDYYLYLKTSENFQNATYTGNIYLGIQNSFYLD
jgi:hypothetical protein